MSAEYFTEAAVSFIACVTVFTIFLNFLLLAAEELKKCSIIKRKKKNYLLEKAAVEGKTVEKAGNPGNCKGWKIHRGC